MDLSELVSDLLTWIWARHHNELSWYVRPLFLLPFCYFAYRRSLLGILVTLLVFPTSLFWFPAPENPSLRVEGYLAWERQFLTEGSVAARVALVLLNAGTLLKVIWSVVFGGAAGWASLAPSLFTLAVTDAAIVLAARWLKRRRARQEDTAQDAERDADLTHRTQAADSSGVRK
jgi:hypothetical protein